MVEQAKIVRWEAPPPPARGGRGRPAGAESSRYSAIAIALRERPGEWALVEEAERASNTGLATKIQLGSMLCFTPAGDFEAVTRQRGRLFRTYARYLGDGGGNG